MRDIPDSFGNYGPIFARLLIFLALFVTNAQSAGMRIQNLMRPKKPGGLRLLVGLAALILVTDSSGVIPNRLGLSLTSWSKLRGVVNLAGFLAFLGGFTREVRPENIVSRSEPSVAERDVVRTSSGEFIGRFLLLESLSSIALMVLPAYKVEVKIKELAKRWFRYNGTDACACASCGSESMVFPQTASPCSHAYCYYCISSEDKPFRCYRCDTAVHSYQPSSTR